LHEEFSKVDDTEMSQWAESAIDKALMSPLFSMGSGYPLLMQRILDDKGKKEMADVVKEFQDAFSSSSLRLLDTSSKNGTLLKRDAGIQISSEAYQKARAWAVGTEDHLCVQQLEACDAAAMLLKAFAEAAICITECGVNSAAVKMQVRKVSERQVECVKQLRICVAAFQDIFEKHCGIFDEDVLRKARQEMHSQEVDTLLDLQSVHVSMQSESFKLEEAFRSSWTKDLTSIVEAVAGYCPDVATVREQLLSPENIEKLTQFVSMPNKQHHAIGPLCQEIRAQVKLIKSAGMPYLLNSGPELIKRAEQTCDQGIDTVTLTFALKTLYEELPQKESLAAIITAVDSVRSTVGPTGIALPQQVEDELTQWREGKKTEATEGAQQEGDVQQESQAESQSSQQQATETAAPGSAKRSRPVEEQAVAPTATDAPLTLAQRAAQAKRKKIVS